VSTLPGGRLQAAAAAALLVGYALLSHYCIARGARDLGAALALAPLTLLLVVAAWRALPVPLAVPVSACIAGLLYVAWPLLAANFSLLAFMQDSSVYCILGLTFGRSLTAGQTPLCTQLAARVHGSLAPEQVRYSRRVTAAWSIFFAAIVLLSVLLYAAEPKRIWSIYMNFCVVPLVVSMFVGEYAVRQRVLPHIKPVGVMASIRVYLASPH
jgi:uncharacterized membrane protein